MSNLAIKASIFLSLDTPLTFYICLQTDRDVEKPGLPTEKCIVGFNCRGSIKREPVSISSVSVLLERSRQESCGLNIDLPSSR